MRTAFALATAVLVLLTAVAPHAHDGILGAHTCIACVARDGDPARTETPDLAPARVVVGEALPVERSAPVTGVPLGAIPGQSPPAA